jgi:hypothetical protein
MRSRPTARVLFLTVLAFAAVVIMLRAALSL